MKVLIIEDEELAAGRLKKLLLAEDKTIEIEGPIDTVKNAIEHLQKRSDYDIIFLDIQLADGRSFSIFESIQVSNPIIFTTAFDEYAVKAFELNSIDYLLKPINAMKLHAALDKFSKMKDYFASEGSGGYLSELVQSLKKQTGKQYQSRFLVNKADSLIPIMLEEIAYFFAEDKVVFLIRNDGTRTIINHTLDDIEQRVDPGKFFRVNRQYLVSVGSIRKVHLYFNYKLKLDLQPSTEEDVIVSKLRTAEFKQWMNG
jgi:DNA-binding LytR/AlgR family response regulator